MENGSREKIICPHCGQEIFDQDALLCLFCGNSLNRASTGGVFGAMQAAGSSWGWIMWPIIGFIVLLAVALTMANF